MTPFLRIATWLLIGVGLILSLLSGTDLCNFGGCTDAHQYRFYGLKLPVVGACFFVCYAATSLCPPARPISLIGDWFLAGAVGAEAAFIHLQKYVIQAWCPLCIGIAAVVGLLALLRIINFSQSQGRVVAMTGKFCGKILLIIAIIITSFSLTLNGMAKSEAQASDLNIALGKQNSKVEVYVFSDWFCPSCIKIEPIIESVFPAIAQKARVHFIDKAIHPESMNFVPYHISFAVKEKAKYIQLRRVLFALAKQSKNPTVEEVKSAIAPLKVTYQQLSFLEVSQTMAKFQALSEQFKIKGTPTIIVTNSTTRKSRKLYGANEISADSILKAIREME